MNNLKELVGSIIASFLGPNKSNKFIIQDEDVCMTKCPLHIFQSSLLKDPLSCLIEETLFAHHELYGCSTLSLLSMWYLWHEEFKLALEEGLEIRDITLHSQDILEVLISSLPDITESIDSFLNLKKLKEMPRKELNAFGIAPVSILYSSRHFSPSQTVCLLESENYCKNDSELDADSVKIFFQRLDHNEDDGICDLIFNCWNKQRFLTNCSKFQSEGILICPIILPCSNSTVLDGLIINSNHNYHHCEKNPDSKRTLIIQGSLTFEHMHLGFSPKVLISVQKTSDSSFMTKKEIWREKCYKIILQLSVDVLLVKDDVDPAILDFCISHDVLVLFHIPLKTLKLLCQTLQYSPCSYIWDCTEEKVIKNLNMKMWKPCVTICFDDQYFLCNVHSTNRLPLQTIVLCHPSQAVLKNMEHQMEHFISRLSLCFQSKKLLPGGKAEEWCGNFLMKCPQFHKTFDAKARVTVALANGYFSYSKIISNKKALSPENSSKKKKLDELSSKLSAWRSALSLVLLTLQCDAAIINSIDHLTVKHSMILNAKTL